MPQHVFSLLNVLEELSNMQLPLPNAKAAFTQPAPEAESEEGRGFIWTRHLWSGKWYEPLEINVNSSNVFGIDGSSQPLETAMWRLGLYSVAISGRGGVWAYPSGGLVSTLTNQRFWSKARFSSLASPYDIEGIVEKAKEAAYIKPLARIDDSLLLRRSRAIEVAKRWSYALYNSKTILDENRTIIETMALIETIQSLPVDLVVVDGPLYATPGLFDSLERLQDGLIHSRSIYVSKALYSLSYAINSLIRSIVVRNLGQDRIAGVVKRLSRSRVLVHALRRLEDPEASVPEGMTDHQLVEYIVQRWGKGAVRPLLIAPTFVRIRVGGIMRKIREILELALDPSARSGWLCTKSSLTRYMEHIRMREDTSSIVESIGGLPRELDGFPLCINSGYGLCKAVGYIYVPWTPWSGGALYRIEVPVECNQEDPERHIEALIGIAEKIADDTLRPVIDRVPSSIALADSIASRVLAGIVAPIYGSLRGRVMFTYETEEVVARVLGTFF